MTHPMIPSPITRRLAPAVLAAALSALAAPAFADEPARDGQWRGAAGASLAVTSGNSSSQALLANLDLARLTADDKWSVGAYANYGRSRADGVTTTTSNKLGGFAQYDHDVSESFFGFGKVGIDHDAVIQMSLRTSLGAGLGLHVVKTKTDTFDVFGGLSWVDTRYSVVQTIGDQTARHFHSAGLLFGEESSHQLSETTSLKQRLEYDPGFSGPKNQLLRFNSTLAVAMSKRLALTVGVTDTYNSQVAAGQHHNDLSVFTGLSVKLGD